METPFDWLSVAVFAGLILLFLQRSLAEQPSDKMVQYLPPALGCAGANWLGNEGYEIPAVLLLVGVVAYVWYVLKPLRQ